MFSRKICWKRLMSRLSSLFFSLSLSISRFISFQCITDIFCCIGGVICVRYILTCTITFTLRTRSYESINRSFSLSLTFASLYANREEPRLVRIRSRIPLLPAAAGERLESEFICLWGRKREKERPAGTLVIKVEVMRKVRSPARTVRIPVRPISTLFLGVTPL